MTTDDYRPRLKRVGVALIIFGVIDICWMIYCIIHGMANPPVFNMLAVIAGIFLMRGGLKTANIVAFFSAMTVSGSIAVSAVSPMLMPLDLLHAYWKLRFLDSLGSLVFAIVTTVFSVWIYKSLATPAVLAATAERYPKLTSWWRRPRTGFLVGLILVLVVSIFLIPMLHGETAERAVAEAQHKVGGHYKFAVTQIHTFTSGGITKVTGVVTAYNDHEIRTISVGWQQ
jgi:hypothetical protein